MKAKVKKYGKLLAKALTMISMVLVAVCTALATSTIDSKDLPMPESWRPYMQSIGWGVIGLRWLVIPSIEGLVQGINKAMVELDKPDEP